MKAFEWSDEKNIKLKNERGISFDTIIYYIEKGAVLDIVPHPLQDKYPGQNIYIIAIEEYAYLVPFIETETVVFLKTIIPSRKATKIYLKR